MKFLCISDVHGNTKALDALDDVFKTVDAVLFAGDFSECFKTKTAGPVLESLLKKHDEIYAVLGKRKNTGKPIYNGKKSIEIYSCALYTAAFFLHTD